MRRALGLLVLLLGCAGCGGTVVATDPVLTLERPIGSASVELVPRTAPTRLPPRSCTPDPTTVQAVPAPLIPRVAREPLSPEGNVAGNEVAAKIRPALEQVCASGDFSLDSTRKALAGQDARVFRADETVTGVAFVITVPAACVLGELRPGNVRISVEGTTKDARCE
ncbi:hypothetical protein UK23_28180 [Lentzea aerocolonigenes]|uniref:Lipoprotein n=1 Tax=Lentzea aerocolonigenes TaxID=68170 RepID=A0A0F0GS79_LENAE|nr:hypothetical protein [Lentzea aerocolonigenes]KJK44842.1 hypothetical protein UK23_28180 [Lentzea aerocolonigenes]